MQTLARHHDMLDSPEDADVSWARRKETIRSALKMFRVMLDAVRRHAEWVDVRHGISAAQLWALWELAQTPGMRAVDLAKAMAVHRTTADDLLEGLVGRDLALRQVNGDGASSWHYFVSEAGRRIADASPEFGQGVLKSALEHLPDASLEQLVTAMHALSECLPFREDSAALQPMAELLQPTRDATAENVARAAPRQPLLSKLLHRNPARKGG